MARSATPLDADINLSDSFAFTANDRMPYTTYGNDLFDIGTGTHSLTDANGYDMFGFDHGLEKGGDVYADLHATRGAMDQAGAETALGFGTDVIASARRCRQPARQRFSVRLTCLQMRLRTPKSPA